MTRKRMIEILASQLERAEGLPKNSTAIIADLREGKLGPGMNAAVLAMQQVERECDLEK